ncbi:MAG TPA: phage tail protein [Pyrinomonadaceae bacterium]|jgi:phage tail-like protein|nr:phage tail protein [Pyrinomonadaceae bacterium]
MQGTHAGHFLVEFDGVAALEATEVTGVGLTHEPVEIKVGTRALPVYSRGKSKIEPVTIKHAVAINSSGRELSRYFQDYSQGLTTEKRSFRVIQLREDGFTPHSIHELIDCVPKSYKPGDNKADGADAAYFMVELQPSDIIADTDG